MCCFGGVDNSKLTRDELLETIKGTAFADQQLSILDAKDEQKTMHVFAESFLNDPLMKWVGGLDGVSSSDEKKKELQYKFNKTMMAWVNRPILVSKKGVVVGVTASDGSLAGAVSVMPGQSKTDTCMDYVNGIIFAGIPPIYTGDKMSYAHGADKRCESLDVLGKKRKELMKDADLNYVYIQTIGVLSSYQGQGLGGKLLKSILNAADSLNIPSYLETESKENEALYQHLGFSTLEVFEVAPNGSTNKLPMYLMRRK